MIPVWEDRELASHDVEWQGWTYVATFPDVGGEGEELKAIPVKKTIEVLALAFGALSASDEWWRNFV